MRQEFVEWTNVRVEDGEFVVVDRSTSAAQRDRNGAYATRNPGQVLIPSEILTLHED
jgi:hypothetical protein